MTLTRMTISIDSKLYKKLIEYHGKRLSKSLTALSLSNTVCKILEEKIK